MRLCVRCLYKRYTKHKGLCPKCGTPLILVDGRLRKVVESLYKSEYLIAFAMCDTYTSTGICTAEIVIGFVEPYDRFIFEGLPEHFEFLSDKYGNQSPYTLNYLLNHTSSKMSMILYEYCGDPTRHSSAKEELKKAIDELYQWALDIEKNKWPVYKLGGWL